MTLTTDTQAAAAERFCTDYAARAYLAPKYDYAKKIADDVSIPLIALFLEMPEEVVLTVLNDEAGKVPRRIIDRAKWAETAAQLLLTASFECELARQKQ
jgi:hypothetical protein